jgi:thiamine-monophosphate kinase
VRRSGAKAGHGLYVTGPLGGSILGRHLSFTPRVALARNLASAYRVSSMIDLSDGLSRDVRHLCDGSHAGATVDAGAVPIHPDVARLPKSSTTPLDHALHDGEDYELLFTSPDPIPEQLATRIGTMTSEPDVRLAVGSRTVPLQVGGWEHPLASPSARR